MLGQVNRVVEGEDGYGRAETDAAGLARGGRQEDVWCRVESVRVEVVLGRPERFVSERFGLPNALQDLLEVRPGRYLKFRMEGLNGEESEAREARMIAPSKLASRPPRRLDQ